MKKSDPRLYMASKGKLNSIYGMSSTAILRPLYEADDDLIIDRKDVSIDKQIEDINHFYKSYNSFMPYQLGIYTTAHARDALMQMVEAVGYENFVYCDTDSVFYIKTPEAEKRLQEMNGRIMERAISAGAYIGDNILGYATDEAPIRRFKALHAKCYAAEELNDKTGEYELHVTIAGIPKKTTKWINGEPVTVSNAEELGSLEALADGFMFRHNGGIRCIYVEDDLHVESINGHMTEYASAAIIENIEKKISDTMYTLDEDYSFLYIQQEAICE